MLGALSAATVLELLETWGLGVEGAHGTTLPTPGKNSRIVTRGRQLDTLCMSSL